MAALLFATACAVAPPSPEASRSDRPEVTARGHASPSGPRRSEFLWASSLGPMAVNVVRDSVPEAPGKPDERWLWFPGFGAVAVPIGVVAPPIAGAMIVGGALLMIVPTAVYGTEKSHVAAVGRAVEESDFPGKLERALQARSLPRAEGASPVAAATILVRGWGVVSPTGAAAGTHCFVAAATVSVARGTEPIYEESLRLTTSGASADAPPPQCASLSRFVANGGRLVDETARDYAELLAVMVLERLARLK